MGSEAGPLLFSHPASLLPSLGPCPSPRSDHQLPGCARNPPWTRTQAPHTALASRSSWSNGGSHPDTDDGHPAMLGRERGRGPTSQGDQGRLPGGDGTVIQALAGNVAEWPPTDVPAESHPGSQSSTLWPGVCSHTGWTGPPARLSLQWPPVVVLSRQSHMLQPAPPSSGSHTGSSAHQSGDPLPLGPLLAPGSACWSPSLTWVAVSCPLSMTCPSQGQAANGVLAHPATHCATLNSQHTPFPGTCIGENHSQSSRGDGQRGFMGGDDNSNTRSTVQAAHTQRQTHRAQ